MSKRKITEKQKVLVIYLDKKGVLSKVEKSDELLTGKEFPYAIVKQDNNLKLYKNGEHLEFDVTAALMTALEYHYKCSDESYLVGEEKLRKTFLKVMNGNISPLLQEHRSDVRRFMFAVYMLHS